MSCVNNRWQICRVCLKNGSHELYPIFQEVEKTSDLGNLPQQIQLYGGIKICDQNNLPNKICSRCLLLLRAACKFRDLCEQSYEQLKQFINPVNIEEAQIVLSPDDQDQDCILLKTNTQEAEDIDNNAGEGNLVTIMKNEFDVQDNMQGNDNQVEEERERDEADDDDDEEDQFIYEQLTENSQDHEFLAEESNSYSLEDNIHIEYYDGTNKASYNIQSMVQESTTNNQATTKPVRATKRKRGRASNNDIKPEEGGIYRCDFCENVYQDKAKYILHIKIHKKVKPHECEICGKRFSTTPQLSRHMNSHTGNRPYKCQFCDASFGDPSTKIKHERIHTNERPYKCTLCPKSFAYSNVLKVHMMVHTGEKPHRCSYCNRAFSQLHHRNAHEKCHTRKIIVLGNEDNDDFDEEMKEYELEKS
ncbi:zinc finger protein 664 [Musca domestica]|uniref:Zinc finger protein 664 n=1 Tax=Musca domestica TaxID=7370 RepID=A0A9J7CRQ0_MUSDO|nr:zinc finger protein 664 [Musca domestica]